MCAAAAQVSVQCRRDLVAGRPGIVTQERRRAHDDPGDAIAALPRLQLEECGLHRVQGVGMTEACQRPHLVADVLDGCVARRCRMTTDPDDARSALAESAAELRRLVADV